MEKRRLGKTDMYVRPVGLGCMGFSHAYGLAQDKETAIQTIRQAYEMGYNFLIQQSAILVKMLMEVFLITKNLLVLH